MLVINNDDILNIVSYKEIIDAIEYAYKVYNDESYYMPDRFHVDYKNKTLLYMPCFVEGSLGTKILTIFPENVNKGIPSLDGLMLLNNYETGEPTCMMDGKTLTALRTGAVGGVGIKHTTPEDVKSVGLIGAGAQGFYQLIYACQVRNFEKIYIFDPYSKNIESFVERLQKQLSLKVEIIICNDSKYLLKKSDVIITTTTATSPTLPENPELLKGKHFIGIGSYKPNMREFPDALYPLLDSVYVDADIALEESGDLIQPMDKWILDKNNIKRFSDFLLSASDEEKERVKNSTSLFKSVGIAIFDLIVAERIYKTALEKNIGYEVK